MTGDDKKEIKEMIREDILASEKRLEKRLMDQMKLQTGIILEAFKSEIKAVVEMFNHADKKIQKNTEDIENIKSDIVDVRYALDQKVDKEKGPKFA